MQSVIIQKILSNINKYPNNCALWLDKRSYTYQELFDRSASMANLFLNISSSNSYCAILSDKNIFAFQSILGLLFAGKAYVPLNPNYPLERNLRILNEGTYELLCLDVKKEKAEEILKQLSPMTICLYRQELYSHLIKVLPKHNYLLWHEDVYCKVDINSILVSQDNDAYLMFTSGSTGQPKGVAVKHSNLSQYISSICNLYQPLPSDKFTQFSELTFDVSVHEIFICWMSGSGLYVVPDSYILGIKNFINKHKITHWTSMPSTITLLHQLKQLNANCLGSIKLSFLCGETLLQSQAMQWKNACPGSAIVNLYGPTEATGGFTYFNWHGLLDQVATVPIGIPLPGQVCVLIDPNESLVTKGEIGEMCLSGSQVIEKYWNNPARTQHNFKKFPWDPEDKLWYRTGDLAVWDEKYGYIYHGRIDDQWQIRGYRVEKLEIENELRRLARTDSVAVVPIETTDGRVEGVIAFVNREIDTEVLLKKARKLLPSHMVPKQIISLVSLPYNLNGKIDYSYLKKYLQQERMEESV